MIVVCGEALFDVFAQQETATGIELSARLGGSPFNLAVGLARLGAPTLFFGGLSHDLFGRRLHAALAAEGIDVSAAPRPDAASALVLVDVDVTGVPSYALYGTGTAERMVDPSALEYVPLAAAAIHVGSYCMVVEPVAATLRLLVERQRGRSLIVYDPNVRLTIAPDPRAWRAALDWMLSRCDILKVSEEDIEALFPALPVEQFIGQCLRQDVALVVVTRGGQGVLAATGATGLVALPAVPVAVVDTVGAGDTFQAGLLAWLCASGCMTRAAVAQLDRARLGQALRFASRAAAITCSRRGADLPYLREVGRAD